MKRRGRGEGREMVGRRGREGEREGGGRGGGRGDIELGNGAAHRLWRSDWTVSRDKGKRGRMEEG